jgi:multiphosphoryl transfer protein
MSVSYRFAFPLPGGMHARPASALEHAARCFAADVSVTNLRTGQTANAKSVLGIVGLDIRHGDACELTVGGDDEREALDSLATFLGEVLPHCDDALPVVEGRMGAVALPRVLAEAEARVLAGAAVVPGCAEGRAVYVGAFGVPDGIPLEGAADVEEEAARVRSALERLVARMDARMAAATDIEADLVRTHRSVARDPEFGGHLAEAIRERGFTAAGAVASAERTFTAMLAATGSALLRERALDIRDVCNQLLREIYGEASCGQDVVLADDSICIAELLTPGQLLALDASRLKGLVLGHAGTTSHTVILARSRDIPTLVGVDGLSAAALNGRPVIVDADLGVLVTDVTEATRRYYAMERARLERRRRRERAFALRPGCTSDGRRVEIAANIAAAEEAGPAVALGAEGVGLFRTEMLFIDRASAPSEDEQADAYRRAVAAAGGWPVIIRTLDVGGDKPLPYLRLPREDNPFLGYRAVRIYEEFEVLFRDQVRALLRASATGPLRVMVPLVSRTEEARWVRRVVDEERGRLSAAGIPFDPAMPLGAMIEVPSAAFLVGDLSRELDFFSIGTNDLLQYFTAADRTNARVERLSTPASPAFIRLLKQVVGEARARGRWVGVCGEMGGVPRYLPLLVGLGVDEISMAAPLVPAAKTELHEISSSAAAALVESALAASTCGEVEAMLDRARAHAAAPLVTPDLVATDGTAATKAEAIKEAVDRLYAAGRTDRPREVEDAVWSREAAYSTGFGNGFAIPHCRTDAVRANSLAVVRLAQPVEWGSLDEKPVRVLILLAVRESDQPAAHLRTIARLARRLVHEEFRARLEGDDDAESVCAFLQGELEVEEG